MVDNDTFRKMVLSFPGANQEPHFHRESFRVKNKIFVTFDPALSSINLKLTLEEQYVYCLLDPAMIYPVAGGWGRQGSTTIELHLVEIDLLKELLTKAYCRVAPPALAKQFKMDE